MHSGRDLPLTIEKPLLDSRWEDQTGAERAKESRLGFFYLTLLLCRDQVLHSCLFIFFEISKTQLDNSPVFSTFA